MNIDAFVNEIEQEDGQTYSKYNRRFHPTNRDLRNHMHRASLKNRFSKCDQENLRKRIKHLKECAPKICFMDASYKTTRYALYKHISISFYIYMPTPTLQ